MRSLKPEWSESVESTTCFDISFVPSNVGMFSLLNLIQMVCRMEGEWLNANGRNLGDLNLF